MGTSGGGGGGGGSGGGGGGGGGTRGGGTGGRAGRRDKPSAYDDARSSSATGRNVAQKVLGRLKPAYLSSQFAGPLVAGVARELSLLKIDLLVNKSWSALCKRLEIKEPATLADVRDKILENHIEQEADVRVRETATATLLFFFDKLCRFDDLLTYRSGSDANIDAVDQDVAQNALKHFLCQHYINVLQREEPTLLNSKSQDGLEQLAKSLSQQFCDRLHRKYSKEQVSEADYLGRAGSDKGGLNWLLNAIRG